ncbi:hypothetical protein FHS79_002282 [Polymorphobacter multimanifer]|uniref:Microcin J25-processing protein McjB C-terminal domain-containing protein n=1 Tax=Polymorphobacter multimanifer TaxID=1070431 RepID=A0A841L659_9SPHN|nr:hypothetical protein [Polymorphobacter multimanifer]
MLDLGSQRYSVLDELATSLWSVLTRDGNDEGDLAQLAADYGVSRAEINRSLEAFAAEQVKAGWLCTPGASNPPPAPVADAGIALRTGSVAALGAIVATALSLRVRGFGPTYRALAERRWPAAVERGGVVAVVGRPFLAAENVILFRRGANDCLVRSLSLYRYLRASGVAATHVIGVRRIPFAAHAWVEVDGQGVLAPAPQGFARLATMM